MVEAADSSSPMAEQARPAQLFLNHQHARRVRQRKPAQSRKKLMPLSLMPKNITLGMPPIPRAPPKKGTYRKTASTMKLMPMVVMARKSSFSLMLGRPRRRPINPQTAMTRGRAVQNESPAFVARSAPV